VGLVRLIRETVGSRARIVHVPGSIMPILSSALGRVLRDVLLTQEEYQAMAVGLADVNGPATGHIALSQWLTEHADSLGRRYANEIDRHFR
jgi:NADH dehydrogenase